MSKKPNDLDDCKTLGLNLLQLMGILAVTGIVVTLVLRHFF